MENGKWGKQIEKAHNGSKTHKIAQEEMGQNGKKMGQKKTAQGQ